MCDIWNDGVDLPSPFTIQLLLGQEKLDDFAQLQDCTDTRELNLSLVLSKRRRPTSEEHEVLAEAIGNNYPRLVLRIRACSRSASQHTAG